MVTIHQALSIYSRALASIKPHSASGGCTPMPRKPNAAASRTAVEKLSVACTINGAAQLGSTCENISRRVPAPATRDAITYSFCSSPSAEPRTSRQAAQCNRKHHIHQARPKNRNHRNRQQQGRQCKQDIG